jgi:hypothetical protein
MSPTTFWGPRRVIAGSRRRPAVDAMGELETKMSIEAARFVARLRRRIGRCLLGLLAALGFEVPVFAFWHELNPYLRGMLFSLFPLAACACLLAGSAAWLQLIEFRCPQCDKWFFAPFGLGYRRNRCKH